MGEEVRDLGPGGSFRGCLPFGKARAKRAEEVRGAGPYRFAGGYFPSQSSRTLW